VCGGILNGLIVRCRGEGLSPRVWGHRLSFLVVFTSGRSIPTCVGASGKRYALYRLFGVYPHVCGGIIKPLKDSDRVGGLSPRVWGHQGRPRANPRSSRSIPTCVGASRRLIQAADAIEVYPHVCGGIPRRSKNAHSHSGLSPRVWGHPCRRTERGRAVRSIPTCVGASGMASFQSRSIRVYPHVCGGISIAIVSCGSYAGLSPRVWGHRTLVRGATLLSGSIPTCVGASDRCC